MKTEQEFLQQLHERTHAGDHYIQSMFLAMTADELADHMREKGVPDDPVSLRVADNAARLGQLLVALTNLVSGQPLTAVEIAEGGWEPLGSTVQTWRKAVMMAEVGNRFREALVTLHSEITEEPLPPTLTEHGDIDTEFWGFTREVNGQPVDPLSIVEEILDAFRALKARADACG
jgi:hypothetical protein